MFELIIATLGTYGVAVLVSDYDGPFNIFFRARTSVLKPLLECQPCLSVWVAVPFAIALNLSPAEYFAVVGASVILARNV